MTAGIALIHDHPSTWPGGGAAIQRRLFDGYPKERLVYVSAFPDREPKVPRWVTHEYSVHSGPTLGRYGLGRARLFAGCLPGSRDCKALMDIFRRHRVDVVHAVAHEFLFIPAFFAARKLGLRFVLALHDHWPSTVSSQLPRWLAERVIGRCLRAADAVLSSHEGMEARLRDLYGVESAGVERDGLTEEEMLPAGSGLERPARDRVLRVGYAGMYVTYGPELDRLREVLRLLVSRSRAFDRFELVSFVEVPESQLRADGWKAGELVAHGWQGYESVLPALRSCNVLFLPMSFDARQKERMEWGMPVKTTPYLQSGTPLLVNAPEYASISALAWRYEFGSIVTEPGPEALLRGLEAVLDEGRQEAFDVGRRRCLKECFSLKHIRSSVFSAMQVPWERPAQVSAGAAP